MLLEERIQTSQRAARRVVDAKGRECPSPPLWWPPVRRRKGERVNWQIRTRAITN